MACAPSCKEDTPGHQPNACQTCTMVCYYPSRLHFHSKCWCTVAVGAVQLPVVRHLHCIRYGNEGIADPMPCQSD
jgi:hypothetical protein